MKILKYFIATTALLAASAGAYAQEFTGLVEGKDYIKLEVKDSTIVKQEAKKPVLIEFFWYGCPHCFKMKPMAQELAKKYGDKIDFVHYPVGFKSWESATRLFFAMDSLNLTNQLHDKVFNEVQINRNNILENKTNRMDFFKKQGVDAQKLEDALGSFSVNTKTVQAAKMVDAYKIDSSPVFAVAYKGYTYKVSPGLVNSYEKTIANLDKILASTSSKVGQ